MLVRVLLPLSFVPSFFLSFFLCLLFLFSVCFLSSFLSFFLYFFLSFFLSCLLIFLIVLSVFLSVCLSFFISFVRSVLFCSVLFCSSWCCLSMSIQFGRCRSEMMCIVCHSLSSLGARAQAPHSGALYGVADTEPEAKRRNKRLGLHRLTKHPQTRRFAGCGMTASATSSASMGDCTRAWPAAMRIADANGTALTGMELSHFRECGELPAHSQ